MPGTRTTGVLASFSRRTKEMASTTSRSQSLPTNCLREWLHTRGITVEEKRARPDRALLALMRDDSVDKLQPQTTRMTTSVMSSDWGAPAA